MLLSVSPSYNLSDIRLSSSESIFTDTFNNLSYVLYLVSLFTVNIQWPTLEHRLATTSLYFTNPGSLVLIPVYYYLLSCVSHTSVLRLTFCVLMHRCRVTYDGVQLVLANRLLVLVAH